MTKCLGCGATLQNKDINAVGYTNNLDNELCTRCFRIKNYNEYKIVDADNSNYLKILEELIILTI